jgi:hypothetical protein
MPELVCGMLVPQFGDESLGCEDQSWFKVQAVPVFRFDLCTNNMFSRTTRWHAYPRLKATVQDNLLTDEGEAVCLRVCCPLLLGPGGGESSYYNLVHLYYNLQTTHHKNARYGLSPVD